jgi:hypothetical protein
MVTLIGNYGLVLLLLGNSMRRIAVWGSVDFAGPRLRVSRGRGGIFFHNASQANNQAEPIVYFVPPFIGIAIIGFKMPDIAGQNNFGNFYTLVYLNN